MFNLCISKLCRRSDAQLIKGNSQISIGIPCHANFHYKYTDSDFLNRFYPKNIKMHYLFTVKKKKKKKKKNAVFWRETVKFIAHILM